MNQNIKIVNNTFSQDDYIRQNTKFVYFNLLVNDKLIFDNKYTFPNEDACLFRPFPVDRLVYPIINFMKSDTQSTNCTCTLLRLVKDYPIFRRSIIEHYGHANNRIVFQVYSMCYPNEDAFIADCLQMESSLTEKFEIESKTGSSEDDGLFSDLGFMYSM
jgi:hypothetical protein